MDLLLHRDAKTFLTARNHNSYKWQNARRIVQAWISLAISWEIKSTRKVTRLLEDSGLTLLEDHHAKLTYWLTKRPQRLTTQSNLETKCLIKWMRAIWESWEVFPDLVRWAYQSSKLLISTKKMTSFLNYATSKSTTVSKVYLRHLRLPIELTCLTDMTPTIIPRDTSAKILPNWLIVKHWMIMITTTWEIIKIKLLEQIKINVNNSCPLGLSHHHRHRPWARSSTTLWIGSRFPINITVSIRISWKLKGHSVYTITVKWWVLRCTLSLRRQEKKLSLGMMMSCTSLKTWEKEKSMSFMVKLIGKINTITFLRTLGSVIYLRIKITFVTRWNRTSKSFR